MRKEGGELITLTALEEAAARAQLASGEILARTIGGGVIVLLDPEEEAAQRAEWAANAAAAAARVEPDRIMGIRSRARAIIVARYPEWKQANMTARALELIEKMILGTMNDAERSELAQLKSVWTWIKEVRATSDSAELGGVAVEDIVWPS